MICPSTAFSYSSVVFFRSVLALGVSAATMVLPCIEFYRESDPLVGPYILLTVLRDRSSIELKDNTIIVVLGASGDLAKKKTVWMLEWLDDCAASADRFPTVPCFIRLG